LINFSYVLCKIIFSNKIEFILETSLFLHWPTIRSILLVWDVGDLRKQSLKTTNPGYRRWRRESLHVRPQRRGCRHQTGFKPFSLPNSMKRLDLNPWSYNRQTSALPQHRHHLDWILLTISRWKSKHVLFHDLKNEWRISKW
jgi:hypothetical protein